MIKVALTGNIASGKSTVQNILEKMGFKVLDTDKVAHVLLDELDEVKETFKVYDVFEHGKISREKLGKLVFSNPDLKVILESIIHPVIKTKIFEFFDENKSETFLFVGIPLLFESDMLNIFDKSLLIYSDDNLREKRLISRNHFDVQYSNRRMSRQI